MKLEIADAVFWWEVEASNSLGKQEYHGNIDGGPIFKTKRAAKLHVTREKNYVEWMNANCQTMLKRLEYSVTQHSGMVKDIINYSPKDGKKLVNVLCFTAGKEVVIESKYLTKFIKV